MIRYRLDFPLRMVLAVIAAAMLVVFPLAAQAQDGTAPEAVPASTQDPQAALAQLIEVLRDDAARQALIAELEAGLAAQPAILPEPAEEEAQVEPEAEPAIPSAELRSFGARIAILTRAAVEDLTQSVARLGRQLADVPRIFSAFDIARFDALWGMAAYLLVLVAITYGSLLALRRLSASARLRLRAVFMRGGWLAKSLTLFFELILDLIAVLIPYALGYALAVGLLGTTGDLAYEYTLYLNAFLMLEVAMAVIRAVVSPAEPEQRLLHVSDREARAIMVWSRLLIGTFIYGQLMVLPLVNATISYDTGRAVSVLLLLANLALIAGAVLVARRPVRNRLLRMIANRDARQVLRGVVPFWHLFALLYVFILAIVALTRTTPEFQAVLWANAQIVIAILFGAIVLNVIKRMLGGEPPDPEAEPVHLALLQRRLGGLVKPILRLANILVVLSVVLFALSRLGLFDVTDFLRSELGGRIAGSAVTVTIILAAALTAFMLVNAWVEGQLDPGRAAQPTPRRRTLIILMRNAITIAVIVITIMLVLSEIGINIAPLLASAGVIGLAIGFGAQRLVQDIITGIFIQLEGAIDVGDVVSVAGISGVVERMTIRSVSLRDAEGSFHVIPFSSVAAVTNFMRGFSYAVIDVTVPYRENVEDVKASMFAAFDKLKKESRHGRFVLGALEWEGVNALSLADVAIRARIKTAPGRQWSIKRSYNRLLKDAFQAAYIGVPPEERPKVHEAEAQADPAPESKTGRRSGPPQADVDLPDPDAGPDSTAS